MTISRKNRRRIVVAEREFIWYVAEGVDNASIPTLTVTSVDRRFLVKYALLQPDELLHVVVIGPEFRNPGCGGSWRRFRSPRFGTLETIAPADVRALIEWALDPEPLSVEVDWRGEPIIVHLLAGRPFG
jgi:hypothetical protein